jgi:hypothetical protein
MVNIVNFVDQTPLDSPGNNHSFDLEDGDLSARDLRVSISDFGVADPGSPRLWAFKGMDGQRAYDSSVKTDDVLSELEDQYLDNEDSGE